MQTSFVPPQRLVRTPFLATVAASQQPGTLPGIRHEAKKGKLKSENTSLILWDFCSKHYFTLCCHHECTLWCWYLHLCLTARANLSQQPTGIALWKGPCWTLKDALPPPFQLIERNILSNSHRRQHNRTTSMKSTAESCTHIWFLSPLRPERKEHRVCINRSFTEAGAPLLGSLPALSSATLQLGNTLNWSQNVQTLKFLKSSLVHLSTHLLWCTKNHGPWPAKASLSATSLATHFAESLNPTSPFASHSLLVQMHPSSFVPMLPRARLQKHGESDGSMPRFAPK